MKNVPKAFDYGRILKIANYEVDNRYIVPYSLYLLLKYGSHIQSFKYLYHYIFKSHDAAHTVVQQGGVVF